MDSSTMVTTAAAKTMIPKTTARVARVSWPDRPVAQQLDDGVDPVGALRGQVAERVGAGQSGRGGVGLRIHAARIV